MTCADGLRYWGQTSVVRVRSRPDNVIDGPQLTPPWLVEVGIILNDGDEGISDATPLGGKLSQVGGMLTRWWRRAPNIAVNDPWL
ncbi:hypothetical protein CSPX01_13716 [Colletotrichum filicis]|nr:hypothetical protein CSPX01_13716 [Colletotrichum filicis]